MDVLDRPFQLIFSLICRVVRELGFVRADQVRSGVDDRLVELEDGRGLSGYVGGEALDLGVEADADERVVSLPDGRQILDERAHATRAFAFMLRFFRWMIRMEMAAGVTPGKRPACPTVSGRASVSFWRTSFERPETC